MNSILKLIKSSRLYDSTVVRFLRKRYVERFSQRIRGLSGQRTYVFADGFKMNLDLSRYIDARVVAEGNYENEIRDAFFGILSPGPAVFIDIGANIGLFTLAARARFPAAKIVSYEPSPELIHCLRENIKLNHFSGISIRQKALSDHSGVLKFYLSTEPREFDAGKVNSGTNSAVFNSARHDKEIEVEGTTLDEEYNFLFEPEMKGLIALKIDVEGYELAVLRGAQRTLSSFDCVVLVEVFDANVEKLDQFLKGLGYRCTKILEGNNRIYNNL